MSFKTVLTTASIALLSGASVLAMPADSEAKDGCGRAYRFSYSQQRCVLRTDVSANRRFQRKADRYCGRAYNSRAYRWSNSQQTCVRRTDQGPRLGYRRIRQQPVYPVVRRMIRPVIRPVFQLTF